MRRNTYNSLLSLITLSLFSVKAFAQPCPALSVKASDQVLCIGESATLTVAGGNGNQYFWSTGGTGNTIVVSPFSTTTYSVWNKKAMCNTKYSITIKVAPLPAVSVNSGTICEGESFTLLPTGCDSYTFSSGSAVVSPTVSTSYTVVGSNNGCEMTADAVASVYVNPRPVITISDGAICEGSSFTLNPSGASTYTFSSGSAIVSPTSTTTYSVSGTSAAGCVSAMTAVNVTVNPVPVANAGPDQTVYLGYPPLQCASLNGLGTPGPCQYLWCTGDTTSNTSVCPTTSQLYTLTVTSNNCSSQDLVLVNVVDVSCDDNKVLICHNGHEICVSVSAAAAHLAHGCVLGPCGSNRQVSGSETSISEEGTNLRIFPNPNTGTILYLNSNLVKGPGQVQIMNSIGQNVYSKNFNDLSESIELTNNLPEGIYSVHVMAGNTVQVTKMIIEK
jgi:hypothetical protein